MLKRTFRKKFTFADTSFNEYFVMYFKSKLSRVRKCQKTYKDV